MKKYLMTEINKRHLLNQYLKDNNVDGILFHSSVNRLWLTEFASTEGYVLYTKEKVILYLDGRYITAGKKSAKNIDQISQMPTNAVNSFMKMLEKDLQNLKVKILGFESEYLSYSEFLSFSKSLSSIQFVGVDLHELRACKTNEEIAKVQGACAIGDIAISNVIKQIKVGMTEKEIEKIIINSFIDNGAEKISFDTIVVSGDRGAMPHGSPTIKKINANELITIDFGCVYQGFCSDTTRTIGIGNPSAELRKIYQTVQTAQWMGIQAVKPNISSSSIDKICRDYITAAGYGEYFTHSTGHGLGIEVHEFPRVSPFVDIVLKPGMIITVEPGIYIPDLGGVRIEDDVLVTETGYELLTKAPRDLICI